MLSEIYKRMVNFISFIKELIAFFLDEMNKRLDEIDKILIEINDRTEEQNEYIEVLKDCAQLNCAECKFNEMCEFNNPKKGDKL